MAQGVWGPLASTVPPVTAPAWTSFLTGMNPGKHGLLDWRTPLRFPNGRRFLDSRAIRTPHVGALLSSQGKTVGLVNVPLTYPVQPVNGFAVGGMLSPRQDDRFSYPPGLLAQVMDDPSTYQIDLEVQPYLARGAVDRLIEAVAAMSRERARLGLRLYERYEPDFFALVFVGPDRLQHACWHILDPAHPAHDPDQATALRPLLVDYYAQLDGYIGQMVERLDLDQTTLILMSDHGFGPLLKHVDLNRWLSQQGWLTYRRSLRQRLRQWVQPLNRGWIKGRIPRSLKRSVERQVSPPIEQLIDWQRTRAFSGSETESGIYLNVRGREPWGVVAPGDAFERLRNEIAEAILRLVDPDTGEPVVEAVRFPEDVYAGPYLSQAPDLMLTFTPGYHVWEKLRHGLFWPATRSFGGFGLHRPDGILVMAGRGVRRVPDLQGSRIFDLTPTILHLLGVPVPRDMDGLVLEAALEPGFLSAHPVAWGDPVAGSAKREDEATPYEEEDREEVEARLRGLGYLS
jgi:predicted AlkP superfamily phosphohydrolase/phosphomutase